MFTSRWLALALGVPLLLLLAGWVPLMAGVAVIYGVALVMMTALDRAAAGPVSQLRVTRQHDPKLSLGVANSVQIIIESRAVRPLNLTVRDEPPIELPVVDSATQTMVIAPREFCEFTYHLRPARRGDFAFGDLNLRWGGPLRLFVRQAVIPATQLVKVYPNIYEIRQYDLLVRRDQLAEMGLRPMRLRHQGTMFESLRDYTPDDPYRLINWKATARQGKPISMDYEPERNQRVVVMLDVGRMMRSAIRVDGEDGTAWNMAKVDFVINSVLLLSYVASRKGDQVGLLIFADRVQQYLPPQSGSAHFQRLLEAMYALGSEPVEADYGQAVRYLRARQKKRALVILFTDLSGARASEQLLAYLPYLAPQHLPLLVTIRDPVLDQEAQQRPSHSDAVYRRAVAEQLIDERRLLLDHLRLRGVLSLDVDAQHLSVQVVNRYLQLKGRALI